MYFFPVALQRSKATEVTGVSSGATKT